MEWLILAAYSLQHTVFANVEESEKKIGYFQSIPSRQECAPLFHSLKLTIIGDGLIINCFPSGIMSFLYFFFFKRLRYMRHMN